MCHCVQLTLVDEPAPPVLTEQEVTAVELARVLGSARNLVKFFYGGSRYERLTLQALDAAIVYGAGLWVAEDLWRKAVFQGDTSPHIDDAEIGLAGAWLLAKDLEARLEPESEAADIVAPALLQCLERALLYYQKARPTPSQ